MDNTIDSLQIEVTSTTTDAQRGLTKLKNSLQKLTEMSNAVANMNGDGIAKLKSMAQGVESLANAGSNPGLSAAVSELKKLSKIDFSNLGTGSEKISEIADKVGEISNANPTANITTPDIASAKTGFLSDYVCVKYKDNHRNNANFIETDVLPFDIDNTHSNNPDDWVTPNVCRKK